MSSTPGPAGRWGTVPTSPGTVPRGALVVMIAPPGAGKSTWVAERFAEDQVLSLDALRAVAAGDAAEQAATPYAAAALDALLRGRMRFELTTVVDATNAEPQDRRRLVALAAGGSMLTVAVVLEVPAATCLAQQQGRARQVPRPVVEAIAARIAKTVHRVRLPDGRLPGFDVTRWIAAGSDTVVGETPAALLPDAPWLR